MDAEAASQSNSGRRVSEQRSLGGAPDRLSQPFTQDEHARKRQPGAGKERRNGKRWDADGSQAVADERERPIAAAAISP